MGIHVVVTAAITAAFLTLDTHGFLGNNHFGGFLPRRRDYSVIKGLKHNYPSGAAVWTKEHGGGAWLSSLRAASRTGDRTASPASSRSPSTSAASPRVLFSKLVRPPPQIQSSLEFLGALAHYLQEQFQLPDRLTMPYQSHGPPPNDDDENNNNNNNNNDLPSEGLHSIQSSYLVRWDSTISNYPEETSLFVQLVTLMPPADAPPLEGASPSQPGEAPVVQALAPTMAMVVVAKTPRASPAEPLPPMLQNLYADSERKILQALEQGLEDFMAGRVPLPPLVETRIPPRSSDSAWSELMLSELEVTTIVPQEEEGDDDQDSPPTPPPRGSKGGQREAIEAMVLARKTTRRDDEGPVRIRPSSPAASEVAPLPSNGLDFAVRAAQQAAARRQQRPPPQPAAQPLSPLPTSSDYAVEAAAQRASRKKHRSEDPRADGWAAEPSPSMKRSNEEEEEEETSPLQLQGIRPPSLDFRQPNRAFRQTISTPQQYQIRHQAGIRRPPPLDPTSVPQAIGPSEEAPTQFISEDDPQWTIKPLLEGPREPTSSDILQAAQDAMVEMEARGKEVTPEELLEEVLQFGQDQERENMVGDGFVRGAFEKAKDLLREQKRKREERLRQNVADQVSDDIINKEHSTPGSYRVRELSTEEELRKMFEAGEQIADGRINVVKDGVGDLPADVDDELESLIAAEKTVSRHSRSLDTELAELEVRINRSPNDLDESPLVRPSFDIFSGPEVYNPNVDPKEDVNWPGALPGSKTVRLPKELDEAVKQAKFAAEVLANARVIDEGSDGAKKSFFRDTELTNEQIVNMKNVFAEAVEIGLIDDPITLAEEESRLQMVIDELWNQPEERMREVASNYKDLMLSDNFVTLIRRRLERMADRDLQALRTDDDSLEVRHSKERDIMGRLVVYAQLLLKEVRALGAELEAQQLEVIRSICKVATDPSHTTEEETAMALTDAVRDMRPLLDDAFVAYLKYAIAEERSRLARAGLLDDPEHNQWLSVLMIVQQGVYAELSRGINRYLEHIWYVLRMETPSDRRMLLKKLIDVMPTLDVRPFVQVVDNMVAALGDGVRGDFDGVAPLGEMTNKLLQLHGDVKEMLPPERIAGMSRDADEWAAKRKKQLLEQRNLTQQRLKAARETEHLDGEIDSFGKRGEIERFD